MEPEQGLSVPYGRGPGLDPVRSAFNMAVAMLEAGRASLLLRHDREPVLVVSAAVGIAPSLLPSIRVPIGQGIAGLVAERGLSLFGALDDQTFISTPVVTGSGVEGVLNLTDRLAGKQYTSDHIAPTLSFARHIGLLLTYSRSVMRDPVSGLSNRRAFEEMLAHEVARSERTGSPFAVLFLDLDNLKGINDRYGHTKGDEVIRGMGDVLRGLLRPYDFAGRYGGDEFAVLLAGPSKADSGIVRRIVDAVGRLTEQAQVEVSISVGAAHYPVDGANAGQLMSSADSRMYQHKRGKRSPPE